MEPAFARGDLLFLTLGQKNFEVGDITVYRIPGKEIPIVHRLMEYHHEYVAVFFTRNDLTSEFTESLTPTISMDL